MGFTADDLVPIGVLFAVLVAVFAVELWWRRGR